MRRTVGSSVLLVTSLVLGGCSSEETAVPGQPSAESTIEVAPIEPAPVEPAPVGVGVRSNPEPDESQRSALLARLAAIDPGLDDERSVRRSRDQCGAILRATARGRDPGLLLDQARSRFAADHLTDEQARTINDAILADGWCVEQ